MKLPKDVLPKVVLQRGDDLRVVDLEPGAHLAILDHIRLVEGDRRSRVMADLILLRDREPIGRVLDAMSIAIDGPRRPSKERYLVDDASLVKWPFVACRPGPGLKPFDRMKLAIVVALGCRWR